MTRRSRSSLLVLGICAALAGCSDQQSNPFAAEERVTAPDSLAPLRLASGKAIQGSYIVMLIDGEDPRSVAAMARVTPRFVYEEAVNGFSATLSQAQLVALQKNPSVAYIEEDQVAFSDASRSAGESLAESVSSSSQVSYASQLDGSKCLTIGAANLAVLASCTDGSNQRFEVQSSGEIRINGNMCLDANGGRGNDGDRIIIWICHGGANQKWTRTSAGELRGINGKCIDVYGRNTADGTAIVLWSCHGGSNQKWTPRGSSTSPPPPPPPPPAPSVPDGITQSMDLNGDPWGIDRVDQRAAPLSFTYSYNASGAGVYVYVVDTGLQADHPEFEGRARNVYDAFGGNGSDCNGHGTHVAGIIGGKTFGVAKKARLRGVKVMDCNGAGSVSGLIAALEWVRTNRSTPAIANLSLTSGYSGSLNSAVDNLANSGVFVVVGAGNNNNNACNYSPSSASGAFTVAASTKTDSRASYSNYGSCVAVYAPGSRIRSADLRSGTAVMTGTSMASPHAAGVAALYKQRYGDGSSAAVASWIKSNATRDVILNNVGGTANRLLYKPAL